MLINNNGNNPNELHDHLIQNGCLPISFTHNAVYVEGEGKVSEATEISIEVSSDQEELLTQLIEQFLS